MIEAQALYINALITKVLTARSRSLTLSLSPKASIVRKYNEEIQARLRESAFADPNCNSWYKNEAGLITNNWSDNVIVYQERTRRIDWAEYEVKGSAAEDVKRENAFKWDRVVEETRFSDRTVLVGMVTAVSAVVAGVVWRGGLLK